MGNFNDCGALTSEQKSYRVGKMLSAQLRLISDIVYHQEIHLVESSISTVHYDEENSADVILIPREFPSPSALKGIVERYKANRLEGLQRDPDAFSSTYERESQFPYET